MCVSGVGRSVSYFQKSLLNTINIKLETNKLVISDS